MQQVPLQRPQLPPAEEIEHYFRMARRDRWFSNEGPCVRLLRTRLAAYVGGGLPCVVLSSGTLGLTLALRAAVRAASPHRAVVVPSFTYVASISAILWAGLEPVFADISAAHWHLDPIALERALSERGDRVAAVLACSTFGCAPPSAVCRAWETLCERASVPLIVDSAAGFGSRDDEGHRLGAQGTVEVFSFHATKPLAIGEGGAALTRDGDLAARILRQANFGLDRARDLVESPGLNAKMSEQHAATALAALDRLDRNLAARAERAAAICAGLARAGYELQPGSERSAWQFVPVAAPSAAARRNVLDRAADTGVQVRTYHQPLHLTPPLRDYARVGDLAVTTRLSERILSLPLATDLTHAEIQRVRSVLGVAHPV